MGEAGNVLKFPVDKVMPTRVAEEKLKHLRMFSYPMGQGEFVRTKQQSEQWLKNWMLDKFVLLGWECVRQGIVKSFKNGRVKHIVADVSNVNGEKGTRPRVTLLCSDSSHPIFNWQSKSKLATGVSPVSILSLDQSDYFRTCERCEGVLKKQRQRELLAKHRNRGN